MNDDELSLRLRAELHDRINPPDAAPEAVHEHLRRLRMMKKVRPAARHSPGRERGLGRLVAAVAICAAIGGGLLLRGGLATGPSGPNSTFSFAPDPSAVNISQHADVIGGGRRFDARTGWVTIARPGSSRYVRMTADGGQTWSKPGEIGQSALDVEFLDTSYGWMVSQSVSLLHVFEGLTVSSTTNGGKTWHDTKIEAAVPGDDLVYAVAVHFRDRLHGVLMDVRSGSSGRTCESYSSSDGGVTWSAPRAETCVGGFTFVTTTLGYAHLLDAQGSYSGTNAAYLTTDGGQTWTEAPFAASCSDIYLMMERSDGGLRTLCRGDSGDAQVLSSSDGGRTWQTLGTAQDFPTSVWSAANVTDNQWIANHQSEQPSSETLVASSDGGLSWHGLTSAALPSAVPLEVTLRPGGWATVNTLTCSPQIELGNGAIAGGTCVVNSSTLFALTDGGATWTPLLTAPADSTPTAEPATPP
jgi:photosystem II stability/assembly factor-like uncharacterized protein